MNDDNIDFSADAGQPQGNITMSEMAEAARKLLEAEAATAAAEEELKAKKEEERKLREETIPSMFAELGIEQLKLADGSTFSCKQEVYCAIPAGRREEAYAWCERNGFGGIIKTEVKVPFGKGELEKAIDLLDRLATELGVDNGTIERSIHPQTLKAFLKERILAEQEAEAAEENADMEEPRDLEDRLAAALDADDAPVVVEKLDLDLFGARPVMTATVKAPPKKKSYARAEPVAGRGQVHNYEG